MDTVLVSIGIILAVILAIVPILATVKLAKALKKDSKIENEITGMVKQIVVMPYIPGGFFSPHRSAQTLVIFEDGERITIEGLHSEIENGQKWRIKYRGTDKYNQWRPIKPFIEKERIKE